MKKKWAIIITALLLLALLLTACGEKNNSESGSDWRFSKETVYSDTCDAIYIITDKETGKQWVMFDGYYCGGLAPYE